MEINEFILGINKVEKYFDKEYTQEQREIMFNSLKDISLSEFNRGVNLVLEKCRYLPKIIDFKQVLAEPNQKIENQPKIDYVKCKNCNGEGFITYYRTYEGHKYEYMALCLCDNGKKQKEINGWQFPFINQINKN